MKTWLKKAVSFGRKDGDGAGGPVAPTPERGLLSNDVTSSSVVSPARLDLDRVEKKKQKKKSGKKLAADMQDTEKQGPARNRERVSGADRQKSKASNRDHTRTRNKDYSTSRNTTRVASRDLDSKMSGMKIQSSSEFSISQLDGSSTSTVGQRSALPSSNQSKGMISAHSIQPQSDDELARVLAEEENASYYASLQNAMAASAAQQRQGSSNSGNSNVPDLQLARALAESQFAARQANELLKAKDSMFEAAVSKAMEESMSTAEYDGLLRDIKMWIIDLDAASDDVVSALNMISKRREDTATKLEKALEKGDGQRVAKMLWESEMLPEIQRRIVKLQENIVPIGIATSDLQSLRDKIIASYPPLDESQKSKDAIIETMFKALRKAKLRFLNVGSVSDATVQNSEDCQDSSDLRDFISALVDDAKRIPRVPNKVAKQASMMVQDAFREQQASFEASEITESASDKIAQGSETLGTTADGDSSRAPSECKTEASSTPTELQSLVKASADRSLDLETEDHVRSSSNQEKLSDIKKKEQKNKQRLSKKTVPQPFNLSKSRQQYSSLRSTERKKMPIRRVPAFFTLHHEIMNDRGIVNQTVDWKEGEYITDSILNRYLSTPAPADINGFFSDDVHELLAYVKKQAENVRKQSMNIPGSSKQEDKWYTMCKVAGAVEGLEEASEKFLTWTIPNLDSITDSCQQLKDVVNQILDIISNTAYTHDTLRIAMKKHGLPWDENLISQVRSDAQHAAFVIMRAAIDCAEEAERKRGSFKRQKNVLKPLGQAAIATFSVHQLAGGFGDEAAEICDELVELTVHYARQLDPKWFRGTKVVRS